MDKVALHKSAGVSGTGLESIDFLLPEGEAKRRPRPILPPEINAEHGHGSSFPRREAAGVIGIPSMGFGVASTHPHIAFAPAKGMAGAGTAPLKLHF